MKCGHPIVSPGPENVGIPGIGRTCRFSLPIVSSDSLFHAWEKDKGG